MREAEFMASREVKVFLKAVEEQYGAVPEVFSECAFSHNKERISMVTRDLDKIQFERLRINSLGLYIAELKNGQLRLGMEGAQIVGPVAKKNVCEISTDQLKAWLQGHDLSVEGDFSGFVILKHGADYVGSGKFKEGIIMNYVPKARRLSEVH